MVSALMMIAAAAAASGDTLVSNAKACQGLLPNAVAVNERPRPIAAADLLRLRDIGQPDTSVGGPSPLAVAPDGRRVAFVLTQADPITNQICHGVVVLDLERHLPAFLVDGGGDAIRAENVQRGARTGSGLPATIVPAWSPDGSQLAFLKRVDGKTQVWRTLADRRSAERVTDSSVDVEEVAWSFDGDLLFATRPGRLAFQTAKLAEARQGYLFDRRVIPANGFGPQLPADLPRVVWRIDVRGRQTSVASPQDAARLPGESNYSLPSPLTAFSKAGRTAGAEAAGPSPFAGRRIWAEDNRGRKVTCAAPQCVGAMRGVWWHPDGRSLLFLRYEGWNNEDTALYRWTLGTAGPRRLLATQAALVGCAMARRELLCLDESALSPRRIVAIDVDTLSQREVFDPNPQFSALKRPRVERLRWKNDQGLPAWGDLVLPEGSPPPTGWPLVIVQYTSRGFLRGGTGDEFPILAMAARGMAVLSFQRPPLLVQARPDLDLAQSIAEVHRNWSERRSTHASLAAGLERVLARGDIDRQRIGITGLSDGATTARYALIAGMKFRAASLSTCCRYMPADLIYGGTVVADEFRSMGFPAVTEHRPEFYAPLSFPQAASRLHTPLLLQLSDEEGLFALETFAALREHEVPVELRIFPDEYHLKWQPAHRSAVYTRNLDWFSFWLLNQEDADSAKQDQYQRWREWRDRPSAPKVALSTP